MRTRERRKLRVHGKKRKDQPGKVMSRYKGVSSRDSWMLWDHNMRSNPALLKFHLFEVKLAIENQKILDKTWELVTQVCRGDF